jgi:hypothetical protein
VAGPPRLPILPSKKTGIASGRTGAGEGVLLMRKFLIAVTAAFAIAAVPMTAEAAPCRDSKGKFIKCPPAKPAAAPKKGPCRDTKGKFIKCK